MNDKETVVFLDTIRGSLQKGQIDVAVSMLEEKIKRIGMKHAEQILTAPKM